MPLDVEAYHPAKREWIWVNRLEPGDRPGSLSDTKQDGKRDIYVFTCLDDDSCSNLLRSKAGFDIEMEDAREITSFYGFDLIKMLRKNEPHELSFTSPTGTHGKVRFTHR